MPDAVIPAWRQPGWLEDATAWMDAALAAAGRRRSGPVEQPHLRPWSTVLAAPTDAGMVYLKTTAAGTANDAGLTAYLAPRAPDLVLAPIAAAPERRLVLLPHGGERLRDVAPGTGELPHWERLLPRYALLQRRLAPEAAQLRAAGGLDRRLGGLAAGLRVLLDDPAQRLPANPHGVTDAELTRLHDLLPRVAAAAEELAAGPVVESIQHDDLHGANVLLDGDEYRIFDWGDASVTHPYGTLLVTLRSVAHHADLTDGDPALDRLRDAYLEPWTDLATRDELRRVEELATWLGLVVRGLVWRGAILTATAEELPEWQDAVPDTLRMLLERVPA